MFELCLVLGLGFLGVVGSFYYVGRAISFDKIAGYLIEYMIVVPRPITLLTLMVLTYPIALFYKGRTYLKVIKIWS